MEQEYRRLRRKVMDYYQTHGRSDLPWRRLADDRRQRFYEVWISEMMLQQTGVSRVIPKYKQWFGRFPTIESIAKASLGDVLKQWHGLGYNRRAKFIWEASEILSGIELPDSLLKLPALSGVGANTLGAIIAYVDNQPSVFVETNIRTVFLHEIEKSDQVVSDGVIRAHVAACLPKKDVRTWYWALMDYGSYLKKSRQSHLQRTSAHKKQSSFHGSNRQIRGMVIRELTLGMATRRNLAEKIADNRLNRVLDTLMSEGLIVETRGGLKLP